MHKTRAVLVLADGTFFKGYALGVINNETNCSVGEVVFNTSMFGYQEIMTDPSYAGQIMCFTSAQIGNVGCNKLDVESNKVHIEGIIIKNYCNYHNNWRAEISLDEYLKINKKTGIYGIDTRALVQHLRDNGAQMGVIACGDDVNIEELVSRAKSLGSMEGKNFVKEVTCQKPYSWNEKNWCQKSNSYDNASEVELENCPHIVAVDCGIKNNILRLLVETGFRVTVVPAYSTSKEILDLNPNGVFLSNGPGDPATLQEIVKTSKELLGKVPIFGICLGHQILCQAIGGKTYKLKFGHRGGNHPVIDNRTKKVEITSQNHGFAVDAKSLQSSIFISHTNLNDLTIEGLDLPEQSAFSVQYHPEASPGPRDSEYLFKRFYRVVMNFKNESSLNLNFDKKTIANSNVNF